MVLWGCPPPRGYLSVSSVPPEEHGIEGPVPRPPGGPLVRMAKNLNKPTTVWVAYGSRSNVVDVELATILDR